MNDRIFKGSFSSLVKLVSKTTLMVAKWAMVRGEFSNFTLNDIISNWEACLV